MEYRVGVSLGIIFLFAVAMAPPVFAIDAALLIATTTQGTFNGENPIPERVDTIEILGYADALIQPVDPATGLPTGIRQCKPLFVRKLIDRTTPLFAKAWATAESTTQFQLRFYRASDGNYFTIELTGARIISISRAGGENDLEPSEQIGFVYAAVMWTHETSGVVTNDTCGP